jgi:hypothetical protein
MQELIQCRGTINCNGLNYLDPLINVYYLSYNSVGPILAFPQLVNNELQVFDQLFMALIDNGPTVSRYDVTNSILMLLEQEYTQCTFTLTAI